MTPIANKQRRDEQIRLDYFRKVEPLHARRDQLVILQRNHLGALPDDLAQEKRDIEDKLYQAGREFYDKFKQWAGLPSAKAMGNEEMK